MLDTEEITPLEAEEHARSRIWERVQAGMAEVNRRRRRRAVEALILGAALATLAMAVLRII